MKDLVRKLHKERRLEACEYRSLLLCEDRETIESLHEAARETAVERFGKNIYIRGLIEITSAATTAFTAAYGKATVTYPGTCCQMKKSWNAAVTGTDSDSVRSSFREASFRKAPMMKWKPFAGQYMMNFPTAPLPCRSENVSRTVTEGSVKPERHGISSAMKRIIRNIIPGSTRRE